MQEPSAKQIFLKSEALFSRQHHVSTEELSLPCQCSFCSKPHPALMLHPVADAPSPADSYLRVLLELIFNKKKNDIVDLPVLDTLFFQSQKWETAMLAYYDQKEGLKISVKRAAAMGHGRVRRMMMNRLMDKEFILRKRRRDLGQQSQQNLDERQKQALKQVKQQVQASRVSNRQFFLLKEQPCRKRFIDQIQFLDLFRLKASSKGKAQELQYIQCAPLWLKSLHRFERINYSSAQKHEDNELFILAKETVVSQLGEQHKVLPLQAAFATISEQKKIRLFSPWFAVVRFRTYMAVVYAQLFNNVQIVQMVAEWARDQLEDWYLSDVYAFKVIEKNCFKRENIYSQIQASELMAELQEKKKVFKKAGGVSGRTYERLSQQFQDHAVRMCQKYSQIYQQVQTKIVNPQDRQASDHVFQQINPRATSKLSDILKYKRKDDLLQLTNNFVEDRSIARLARRPTRKKPKMSTLVLPPRHACVHQPSISQTSEYASGLFITQLKRGTSIRARSVRRKRTPVQNLLSLKTLLTLA